MSADNYLLIRSYDGGFLVTSESMSEESDPSDPQKALERALGPNSDHFDGFFDDLKDAEDFVKLMYEAANNGEGPFIEYGPSRQISN